MVVWLLMVMDTTGTLATAFYFNPGRVLQGQIWRLVTFPFVPDTSSPIFIDPGAVLLLFPGHRPGAPLGQRPVHDLLSRRHAGHGGGGSLALILIVLYEMISIVFSVNDSPSQMNVQGFFMEQKDSLDVLMIGSSEVYSDYSPAIAWENYG